MSIRADFLQNHEHHAELFNGQDQLLSKTVYDRSMGFGAFMPPFSDKVRERADAVYVGESRSHAGIALLASAYQATGVEAYADKARDYYLGWMATTPLGEMQAEPVKYMDVIVHGLYGWLGTLHALLPSPAFSEAITAEIIASARGQLQLLHENLYPYRNLLFSYSVSLLANSLRLRFLQESGCWLERAVRVINDGCRRQLNPDGSHLEATPHYHHCTMGDILNAWRHGMLLPELGLNLDTEKIAALYDYLAAATTPAGWVTGIHDGQPGSLTHCKGNGITDTVEERASFRAQLGLPAESLPAAQFFPYAGQVFMRDNWTPDSAYLTFEASPCRSFHWHPCGNSIQLYAHGRMLLVDPGRFSYKQPEWQQYAGRTLAHTTLNLNGWDQVPTPISLRQHTTPGYELVHGLYSGGYWAEDCAQGIPAEHHRSLLWLRQRGFAVVIDNFRCRQKNMVPARLESVWQLGEGEVVLEPERKAAHTAHADANLLFLFPMQSGDMNLQVYAGATAPRRGWLPEIFEQKFIPAPQVVLTQENFFSGYADLCTVLIPYAGGTPPAVIVTGCRKPEEGSTFRKPGYGFIALRQPDGTTDEIYWRQRLEISLGEQREFSTDAGIVHLQRGSDGRINSAAAIDGTYCTIIAPA